MKRWRQSRIAITGAGNPKHLKSPQKKYQNPNLEIAQNYLLRSDLYLEQKQVLAAIVLLIKATQLDPDNFSVAPLPDSSQNYDVRMIVCLKPLRTATKMDKKLYFGNIQIYAGRSQK